MIERECETWEEKESSKHKVLGNTMSWVFGSDIKSLK